MNAFSLALFVAVSLSAPRAAKPVKVAAASAKSKPATPAQRELKQRQLRITDATGVSELRVARGISTQVVFPSSVDGEHTIMLDVQGRMLPLQTVGPTLLLLPKEDLKPGENITLQVVLSDGNTLPFMLLPAANEIDLRVEVELALVKRASADSASVLKSSVNELQARLDACTANSAEAGNRNIAALVLRQDHKKPGAFIAEQHPVSNIDKQSRLLVEAHAVYRLFDRSYLLVSIENRDPAKAWVLERAEVATGGGGAAGVTAQVTDVQLNTTTLRPGETAKAVVTFVTPPQEAEQRYTLKLFEKGGERHVTLDGLKL